MKNPWPVALTIIIAGAFAFATFVAVTMIRQRVDLVSADYYDKGVHHEQRMIQEQRARALPKQVEVSQIPGAKQVIVTMPDAGATGTITLYRPSDSTLDRTFDLALDEQGRHVIDYAGLAPGLWRLEVAWKQNGEDHLFATPLVLP